MFVGSTLLALLKSATVGLGLFLVVGTLINQSRHPHWFVRGWDFPRLQTAILALLLAVVYGIFWSRWVLLDLLFLGSLLGCIMYQCYKIYPYTPLVGKMVKQAVQPGHGTSLRLLIANVLQENRQYDRLLELVRRIGPDLVLAVEVDQKWTDALKVLESDYPHTVQRPQENAYGIALYCRYRLVDSVVRFIVQDDVPSIRVQIELPCGQRVMFYGLHPRPPEPIRDQDAKPRDAELVVVGREVEEESLPVIIAGDLNDVAWSHTTELFLRISRLLDPRIGRGLYNTFSAHRIFWRFPLDHIFHSRCFQLMELRVLDHIGSDHFPVLAELAYVPEEAPAQPPPAKEPRHEQEAQEKINRQEQEEHQIVRSRKRRPATS